MNVTAAIIFGLGVVIAAYAILARMKFRKIERAILIGMGLALMIVAIWWI